MRLSKSYVKTSVTSNTCRLCLRVKVSSTPIFTESETSERLRGYILECCPVTLFEDDRLPNVICDECEQNLIAAYEFRERCRDSERKLRLCCASSYSNASPRALSSNYKILRNRSVQTDDRTFDRPIEISTDPVEKGKRQSKSAKPKRQKVPRKKAAVDESERSEEEKDETATEDRNDACSVFTLNTESEFSEKNEDTVSRLIDRVHDNPTSPKINQTTTAANTNDKSTENRSKVDEPERRFLCHVCSKTFVSSSGLQLHLKSHMDKKPYLCRYCGKGFVIPSYARRHEQIHSGNKCFVCEYCSAAFVSLNGLRYHQRSHTGKANFRCDTCGKAFHRSKYLKEHIFTHTGEKPYVCKICDSAYGNSGSLFVHEKKCKARLLGCV